MDPGSIALIARETISPIVALSSVLTYRAAPALTDRFGGLTRPSYNPSHGHAGELPDRKIPRHNRKDRPKRQIGDIRVDRPCGSGFVRHNLRSVLTGEYERIPAGSTRRIADVAERGLERILLRGKRSFLAVWPGLPQSLSDTTCFASTAIRAQLLSSDPRPATVSGATGRRRGGPALRRSQPPGDAFT
jgi:hypothetical protein